MSVPTTVIDTTPVDLRTAASIEAAEARAWADLYAAAPKEWAESAGVETRTVAGSLVLSWAATGRRYFSRVIGLGVVDPASPAVIDDILDRYAEAGISMFLLQSLPHCRPAEYEHWLRERGLEPFDAQERVLRDGSPLALAPEASAQRELVVECVTRETTDEWAEFIERVYRLDTGQWLARLIGRDGWHQYVVREDGAIVGGRGLYIGPDGVAWLGMDGPVPGVTTADYEPDAALCEFIVADGLLRGARSFITDIELTSPRQGTPSYECFARLGFSLPYTRTHWARL